MMMCGSLVDLVRHDDDEEIDENVIEIHTV